MTTDPVVTAVVVVLLGGLGLIVGSFLNVVIYRVPRDLSIVRPGSACPGCGTAHLAARQHPGRCRGSPAGPLPHLRRADLRPLSPRRGPQCRALARAWAGGRGGPRASTRCCPAARAGQRRPGAVIIDIDHHRLPDAIVLPLYPVSVVGLVFAGLVSGTWPLGEAAIGVGAWLVVIGGIWLLTGGRAMGFGDVKLAPVLGATLGWVGVVLGAGGPAGGLRARRRASASSSCCPGGRAGARTCPSGRSCCSGPSSALIWGEAIGAAYLDLDRACDRAMPVPE